VTTAGAAGKGTAYTLHVLVSRLDRSADRLEEAFDTLVTRAGVDHVVLDAVTRNLLRARTRSRPADHRVLTTAAAFAVVIGSARWADPDALGGTGPGRRQTGRVIRTRRSA
jgi:hypothetical protein